MVNSIYQSINIINPKNSLYQFFASYLCNVIKKQTD